MSSAEERVGDVLRFTHFQWDTNSGNLAGQPFFGVVVRCWPVNSEGEMVPLPPHSAAVEGEHRHAHPWSYNDVDDTYEIVPPDEWPDEVCVAMALRGLGVSVTD